MELNVFGKALVATAVFISLLEGGSARARSGTTGDTHAGHKMPGMNGGGGLSTMTATGTPLRASSPAPGTMLSGSPKEISLTLPHAMTLRTLVLTNTAGQRIPLSATLPPGPVETIRTSLPTLAPGTYSVGWSAGMDGHIMAGDFGFMVH